MKYFIILLSSFALVSCYEKVRVSDTVFMRVSAKYGYEIEIPVRHSGRGNVHRLSPEKYSYDKPNWIYLNQDKGKVMASNLVLTYERINSSFIVSQEQLRGYVEYQNDSLHINLILPVFKDSDTIADGWEAYSFNGIYKIKRS